MHLLTTHDGLWNLASKGFLFSAPLMAADSRWLGAAVCVTLALCCILARKWEL